MTKMAKTRLILALAALIWCVLCLLMSRRDLLEWSQRMMYPEDGCRVETPEHWNVSICSYMVLKDASDVLVLPFTDFLTTPWMSECFQTGSTPEYALVVPDGMYRKFMDAVTVHTVHSMVQVLRRHPWLQVVSGAPVVLESDQRPICTLKRKKWTIELREEYSEFDDGSKSISIRHCDQEKSIRTVLDCYPCDLPPDVFLIRTNLMDEAGDPEVNLTSLAALNASARLPLFMALKGKAAYCPALKVLQGPYNEPLNLTCNDLRMVWDGNFVMIPPLTGVYRLILYPRGDRPLEHWLGCTWAQEAYETKLPVHCSNWVRQFVFDTVDILEKKMKLDYRIVYGLLLGAVRTGDVIPWSVDGDIAVEVSWPHNFRHKRWIRLGEYSQWRYSNKDRYGQDRYPPLRVFPSCPVRLMSSPRRSLTAMEEYQLIRRISQMVKQSRQAIAEFSDSEDWRATGYVDVYYTHELTMCEKKNLRKGAYETAPIAGRLFKTVPNQIDQLECLYGERTWNETPPTIAQGWNSFMDDVHLRIL